MQNLNTLMAFSFEFDATNLFKQGYSYHNIRKAFSKFYHKHSELIIKYSIGLQTLLQQGISEPIFRVIKFINSNELLENQSDDSKRSSNVI